MQYLIQLSLSLADDNDDLTDHQRPSRQVKLIRKRNGTLHMYTSATTDPDVANKQRCFFRMIRMFYTVYVKAKDEALKHYKAKHLKQSKT